MFEGERQGSGAFTDLGDLLSALDERGRGRAAWGFVHGVVRAVVRTFGGLDGGVDAMAQDVTQDTLRRLRRRGAGRGHGDLRALIRRTATNLMRDRYRRQRRFRAAVLQAQTGATSSRGWGAGAQTMSGAAPEAALVRHLSSVLRRGLEGLRRVEPEARHVVRAVQAVELSLGLASKQDILRMELEVGPPLTMKALSSQLGYAREKLVRYIAQTEAPEIGEAVKELLLERTGRSTTLSLPRIASDQDRAFVAPDPVPVSALWALRAEERGALVALPLPEGLEGVDQIDVWTTRDGVVLVRGVRGPAEGAGQTAERGGDWLIDGSRGSSSLTLLEQGLRLVVEPGALRIEEVPMEASTPTPAPALATLLGDMALWPEDHALLERLYEAAGVVAGWIAAGHVARYAPALERQRGVYGGPLPIRRLEAAALAMGPGARAELQDALTGRAQALLGRLVDADPRVTREREALESLALVLRLAGAPSALEPLDAVDRAADAAALTGAAGDDPLLQLGMEVVAFDAERPWWLTPAP